LLPWRHSGGGTTPTTGRQLGRNAISATCGLPHRKTVGGASAGWLRKANRDGVVPEHFDIPLHGLHPVRVTRSASTTPGGLTPRESAERLNAMARHRTHDDRRITRRRRRGLFRCASLLGSEVIPDCADLPPPLLRNTAVKPVAPLRLISGRNIAHRSKLPSRNAGLALPFWER
jgi:hypothetical protein